jgi:hypothetical protein
MTEQTELSGAELVFVQRMLPHFMAGKSVEECAKAVLADDERLYIALHQRRHSQFVPTYCERGRSYHANEDKGDVVVSELSRTVYERIRGGKS